jgi:hypothetical protein
MSGITVFFLVVASVSAVASAAGVLWWIWSEQRSASRGRLTAQVMADLARRLTSGETISHDEVEALASTLTVGDYARSPEDRLVLTRLLLGAAARGTTLFSPDSAETQALRDLVRVGAEPSDIFPWLFERPEAAEHRGVLVFVGGPLTGASQPLQQVSSLLGSSQAADIHLTDDEVQPSHAMIWNLNGEYVLAEIAIHRGVSAAPVLVNGLAINRRPTLLKVGDSIQIGSHTMVLRSGADVARAARS